MQVEVRKKGKYVYNNFALNELYDVILDVLAYSSTCKCVSQAQNLWKLMPGSGGATGGQMGWLRALK